MCTYQKVFLFGIHFFKKEKFLKYKFFESQFNKDEVQVPDCGLLKKKEKDIVWKYQHELVFGKQGDSLEQSK